VIVAVSRGTNAPVVVVAVTWQFMFSLLFRDEDDAEDDAKVTSRLTHFTSLSVVAAALGNHQTLFPSCTFTTSNTSRITNGERT
jgi:hypothetical protein